MIDLRAKWHGAPVYVWVGGGTVVGVAGLILLRRARARRAGNTVTTQGTSTGSAPLPGYAGLSSALGPLGGSSPSGPLSGYTSGGEPVYGLGAGADVPADSTDAENSLLGRLQQLVASAPQPAISGAPAAPVVSASTPAIADATNRYSLGQQVSPSEKIVSSLFSPRYGWLNLTNLGGIYTGSSGYADVGGLPYGGSYLGYAATQPDVAGEVATHGSFGAGGLSLLPGGGYTETNTRGETYEFA